MNVPTDRTNEKSDVPPPSSGSRLRGRGPARAGRAASTTPGEPREKAPQSDYPTVDVAGQALREALRDVSPHVIDLVLAVVKVGRGDPLARFCAERGLPAGDDGLRRLVNDPELAHEATAWLGALSGDEPPSR